MEKTSGTIIQLSDYSETSLIVQWCTPDHGLIRTIAKGARRPKSGFAGKLDLFFYGELEFVQSRKSDLHTLREVALLDPRIGIRQTYIQTLAASYFASLLRLVAEEGTPIPDLADLLERALNFLVKEMPTPRAVAHFENQTAEMLGLGGRGLRGIGQLYGRIPAIRKELLQKIAD